MFNYYKYVDDLSLKEYIVKVCCKEIYDLVLNFQIFNDFYLIRILCGYLEGDGVFNEFVVFMEWDNIYYEVFIKKVVINKWVVCLGLIQWQM